MDVDETGCSAGICGGSLTCGLPRPSSGARTDVGEIGVSSTLPRSVGAEGRPGGWRRWTGEPAKNLVALGSRCGSCLGRGGMWGPALPFERVITLFREPAWSPFVSLSAISFPSASTVGSVESILQSRSPPPPDIDMTTKSVCGRMVTLLKGSNVSMIGFVTWSDA
jgi:hypothetical protein